MKVLFGISLWILCVFTVIVSFVDAISFIRIMKGDYKTPWYDKSFLRSPVQNSVFCFCPSGVYVTTNAIGNEEWLCKEVYVKDKAFWTILEKKDIVK